MKLREQILKEHSKANREAIVNWIGTSQERFDQLFKLFLNDEYRVTQRAAWPMSYAVKNHPELIRKHLGRLIKNLEKQGLHDSVKRNSVRILRDLDIPERYHGQVMNTCFRFIESPDEAVAIKAFSLIILEKLLPQYPDIKNELKLIIEERWEYEKPAFRGRAKKILKNL